MLLSLHRVLHRPFPHLQIIRTPIKGFPLHSLPQWEEMVLFTGGPSPNVGSKGFSYGPKFSMNNFWQPGASKNPGYSFQNVGNPSYGGWNSQEPPRLPILATLNFLDLSKLTNNPIQYSPGWPPVPTKLPSDIPKFEGKNGED